MCCHANRTVLHAMLWTAVAVVWLALPGKGDSPMVAGTKTGTARPDTVQAVLDRVAKMSFGQQQAWLAELEQRADRAVQQRFSSDEAAKQQERIRSLLHQKVVTWQVLRTVVAQIEVWEKKEGDSRQAQRRTTAEEQPPAKPQAEQKAAAKPQAAEKPIVRPQAVQKAIAKPQAVEKPIAKARAVDTPVAKKLFRNSPLPLGEGTRRETASRPHVAEKPISEPLPPDSVQVNVEELETRIAACNLAIRAVEAELDEKGVWSAAKIEPLLDRLKTLAVRRGDLDLFRELVPASRRETVAALESPKSAIAQLRARVVEARGRANRDDFAGGDAARNSELGRLKTISGRLAEMAEK
jgi:hypothetical protein